MRIFDRSELDSSRRGARFFADARITCGCFGTHGAIGTPRQHEAGNPLEFVRIQPGPVFVAPVDDHAGTPSKIASNHHRIAGGTATVFDAILGRISAGDTRRGMFCASSSLARSRRRAIDQHLEHVVRCPEAVAFCTFLNDEPGNLARHHPPLAAGTAKLGSSLRGSLRLESDPAGQAEASVIEIARHALGADQAPTLRCLDDPRTAIIADLVAIPGDGPTGTTAPNRRVDPCRRYRLERRPTTTIEGAPHNHQRDIVLRMAICTGDQLHAIRIGSPVWGLDPSPRGPPRR